MGEREREKPSEMGSSGGSEDDCQETIEVRVSKEEKGQVRKRGQRERIKT